MRKFFLLTGFFILLASPVFAAETVLISVNGLVCDFCARAIEKVFGKQEAVESVSVDLDAKIITVKLKDGKSIGDDLIKELVTDAGYNIVNIKREKSDE